MELEGLHVGTLVLTALVILYSDHQAFGYFRGTKQTLAVSFVTWSHRLVWIGLLGMIGSGFFLVLPEWEYWLSDPVFYVKMGFVVVLCINAFFIGKLSHVATQVPFTALDREKKQILILSGALSAIGWIGATVIGFFFL